MARKSHRLARTKRGNTRKLRNAARPPRAKTARSDETPTAVRIPTFEHRLTRGESTIYAAGGMTAAALSCALLARANAMPAWLSSGLLTLGGGAVAALARSERVQSAAQGVMTAAGGQLGLVILDNHYQQTAAKAALVASKLDAKKPANADNLPPGALEAAYERARRRVALAHASSQAA